MPVVNKYTHVVTCNTVNIMRPSVFGNPFVIGKDGNRAEVIAKFKLYALEKIAQDPIFAQQVKELLHKDLMCCCKPAACHGDVLEDLAVSLNMPMDSPSC